MDWNNVRKPVNPQPNDGPPEDGPIVTFWVLVGPSGRPFTCAAYNVETGLELRASYNDGDIINTELFRGPDARERLEAKAAAWRLACLDKGFTDVASEGGE